MNLERKLSVYVNQLLSGTLFFNWKQIKFTIMVFVSIRSSEGPSGEAPPVIPAPKTPQQIAAQRRLQQTQAQVDEVVDIMRTNVEKVLERDQKLSELDDRAG